MLLLASIAIAYFCFDIEDQLADIYTKGLDAPGKNLSSHPTGRCKAFFLCILPSTKKWERNKWSKSVCIFFLKVVFVKDMDKWRDCWVWDCPYLRP